MVHRRCCAKTCYNVQGPNLKLFGFPKDEETARQWAINSGRFDLLEKPISSLRKAVLCADHFEAHWFVSPQYKTMFLRNKNPIPTIFNDNLLDFVPKSIKESCKFLNKRKNEEPEGGIFSEVNVTENTAENNALGDIQFNNPDPLKIKIENLGDEELEQYAMAELDSKGANLGEHEGISPQLRGFHKLCRLCACMVYEDRLISVFSSDVDLVTMMNQFMSDKVFEGDGLPHDVCKTCVRKLESCYHVVMSFLEADQKLRRLFHVLDGSAKECTEIPVALEDDSENSLFDLPDTLGDSSSEETYNVPDFLCSESLKPDENSLDTRHTADLASAKIVDSLISDSDLKPSILMESYSESASSPALDAALAEPSSEGLLNDEFSAEEPQLPKKYSKVYVKRKKEINELANKILQGHKSLDSLDLNITESYEPAVNLDVNLDDDTNQVSLKQEENSLSKFEDTEDIKESVNSLDAIGDCELSKYECLNCGGKFSEKSKLLFHEISHHVAVKNTVTFQERHTEIKKFKRAVMCKECGLWCKGKKTLKIHERENHIPDENICKFCGAHYKSRSSLEMHLRLHTNEKPYMCEDCGESFAFLAHMKRHRRIHSKESSLICAICNKTFKNRVSIWRHQKIHLADQNVLCYQCGKVLSNPGSLRVHMKTHSTDRPHVCKVCGKGFKTSSSLYKHKLMHSAEKKFACDICQRRFYSKGLVKQHKLSHLGVKPHKCDICGAAFNRLGNLNQHKKKHFDKNGILQSDNFDQPDMFGCEVCGKKMKSELTLKYHLSKHTGEKKPYDCEICGKRFIALDPYRVHMRIHTGERPFVCSTCGKAFRSSFTLKQHASLHRDDTPYACPYCERRFKRLQSLIVHKRTHTGERPHKCPICGRAFAQKGDMIKHTRTHSRDRNKGLRDDRPVIMTLAQIPELALCDSDITNDFLIDMEVVEVETEIHE